jgi:hypothetical protein
MFEIVQFFSHLQLKFAKSAIMTQKNFSWKITIWVKATLIGILQWKISAELQKGTFVNTLD